MKQFPLLRSKMALLQILVFTLWSAAHSQQLEISKFSVPKVQEKSVLRLKYATPRTNRVIGEKRIGFFGDTFPALKPNGINGGRISEDGEITSSVRLNFCRGVMLATDKNRQLYFYDPITFDAAKSQQRKSHRAIRVFSPQGREVRRWWLPSNIRAINAAVTGSGVIWLGVEDESNTRPSTNIRVPILAYQPGKAQPIRNWITQPPISVLRAIKSRLPSENLTANQTKNLLVAASPYIRSSSKGVRIKLYGIGGRDGVPSFDLIVDANSQGNINRVGSILLTENKSSSILAPNGKNYKVVSSGSLWVWWNDEKKNAPILNRSDLFNPNSWWKKNLNVDIQDHTWAIVDGIDNIYILLTRWPSKGSFVKPYPDGKYAELQQLETKSVVVINQSRRVLGYLPWKTTLLRPYEDEWIFPVPDGSGFYRQEFTQDELRIYWHPLPNFKPVTPRKPPRKKR